MYNCVKGRYQDTDKQERRDRIKESRYNRRCERCMTEEIGEYLGKKSVRERKMMARFRCRNEETTGIGERNILK
jgi:hypothetical protein